MDLAIDYPAYIVASGESKGPSHETVRIQASDLDSLVDKTRLTGTLQPTRDFASAIDQAARRGLEDSVRRSRRRTLVMVVGAVLVLAGAVLVASIARQGRPASSIAPPAPVPEAQPTAPIPPPVSGGAAPTAAALGVVPSAVEAPAREALERLRTGMRACILHGIHGLPGSSPPVPAALPSAKGAASAVAATEWRTPVWSCAHFAVHEPMSFQLQWQLVKPGVEGWGVAWMDADGDGTADAALGFSVTFGPKGELQIGEIGPVEASRPVLQLR